MITKARIDSQEVYRRHEAGQSQGEISRALHCDQSHISRLLKARREQEAVSPTVYPEHTAVAPVTPHGIPDIARQSDLDALQNRVEVLEAFIATFQQRGIPVSPNGIPGTPHLTHGIPVAPTTKHSFVIAVDLLAAIQRYAAAHHAQVKDALDYLVRTGLAAVGEEVHADA